MTYFYLSLALHLFLFYGIIFILGIVGESRIIPIWKHQSRAFIPGELALLVTVASVFAFWHSEFVPKSGTMWWFIFSYNSSISRSMYYCILFVEMVIVISFNLYMIKKKTIKDTTIAPLKALLNGGMIVWALPIYHL